MLRDILDGLQEEIDNLTSARDGGFGPQTVSLWFTSVRYGVALSTVTVEVDPQLPKVTVDALWGTPVIGYGTLASVVAIPFTGGATVTLYSSSFEGAQTVGLEDKRKASCLAAVLANTSATCVIEDATLGKEVKEAQEEKATYPTLIYNYPGGNTSTAVCPTKEGPVEAITPWKYGSYYVQATKGPVVSAYNPCSF